MMLFYLVCYDSPCNKRRKQISDLLKGYGKRVQYSVFECVLSREKFCELQERLRKKVKMEEDSLRFYPVSRHTLEQVEAWGDPPITTMPSSVII